METIDHATSYKTLETSKTTLGDRLRKIHDDLGLQVRKPALEGSIYRSKGVLEHSELFVGLVRIKNMAKHYADLEQQFVDCINKCVLGYL